MVYHKSTGDTTRLGKTRYIVGISSGDQSGSKPSFMKCYYLVTQPVRSLWSSRIVRDYGDNNTSREAVSNGRISR